MVSKFVNVATVIHPDVTVLADWVLETIYLSSVTMLVLSCKKVEIGP